MENIPFQPLDQGIRSRIQGGCQDDTVFLAEPGSPTNNRTRIPLRYVYDALKTTSKFQYLLVEQYQEEENQWKESGIDENWNRP